MKNAQEKATISTSMRHETTSEEYGWWRCANPRCESFGCAKCDREEGESLSVASRLTSAHFPAPP